MSNLENQNEEVMVEKKKPYNIRDRKPKEAAYRSLIRAELADELYDKILNIVVVQKKYKDPNYSAKELAKELADVIPDNRYCGWDLALTDDGWVMQEGNWQGGVVAFQCPMQKGCRERMDAIVTELGV